MKGRNGPARSRYPGIDEFLHCPDQIGTFSPCTRHGVYTCVPFLFTCFALLARGQIQRVISTGCRIKCQKKERKRESRALPILPLNYRQALINKK